MEQSLHARIAAAAKNLLDNASGHYMSAEDMWVLHGLLDELDEGQNQGPNRPTNEIVPMPPDRRPLRFSATCTGAHVAYDPDIYEYIGGVLRPR